MSFWKSLFGGGKADGRPEKPVRTAEHSGFRIDALPFPEGGQFQVAGRISKIVDGAAKEHKFIRADRFASLEEAAEFTLTKGRQIVDQLGDRMFDERRP